MPMAKICQTLEVQFLSSIYPPKEKEPISNDFVFLIVLTSLFAVNVIKYMFM